jgi:hypothetical protein
MEDDDFDLRDLFRPKEFTHLYKVHPHFDGYPEYMKQALFTNERLQGRIK